MGRGAGARAGAEGGADRRGRHPRPPLWVGHRPRCSRAPPSPRSSPDASAWRRAATPSSTSAARSTTPTNALLYCAAHLPDPRARRLRARDARGARGADHAPPAAARSPCSRAGGRCTPRSTRCATALPWRLLDPGRRCRSPRWSPRFTDDETRASSPPWASGRASTCPAPSLSLVTIDRLPFPRPDEPLLQARRERARGGRLPRRRPPPGRHDARPGRRPPHPLAHRPRRRRGARPAPGHRPRYRWDIVRALPPMRRTRDRAEVERVPCCSVAAPFSDRRPTFSSRGARGPGGGAASPCRP